MKKIKKDKNFETALFNTLKYYNYSFPKTEKEISEYLKTDGLSKLEMPENLADPDALYDQIIQKNSLNVSAIAAHDEKSGFEINDDLLKRLDECESPENEIKNEKKSGN